MKRVWNPLLPQIDTTEHCESLCRKQIIFEDPPEPTLGFNNTIIFSVSCLSIHHGCRGQFRKRLIFKSVRLQCSSPWRMSERRCHTTDFYEIFLLAILSLLNQTHGAWERKMYSLVLIQHKAYFLIQLNTDSLYPFAFWSLCLHCLLILMLILIESRSMLIVSGP